MLTFAKRLKKAAVEKTSIVDLLESRLSGYVPERTHKIIHASDLTKAEKTFCSREFALLDVLKKQPKPRHISTAMRVTFDNGKALHDLTRNKWLMDDVVGSWRCLGCGSLVPFSKRPKYCCHKCQRSIWQYTEEEFVDPVTEVSGSIDFFIDFGAGKHVPCECKSIDKDGFAALKAPLAEHRVRSQLYLALIARSKRDIVPQIDLSHARLLYISKGFGKKSEEHGKVLPFREFVVYRDDKAVKHYFDAVMPLALFRKGKGPMPYGVCATGLDKRAKTCSCAKECFSGKYQPGA